MSLIWLERRHPNYGVKSLSICAIKTSLKPWANGLTNVNTQVGRSNGLASQTQIAKMPFHCGHSCTETNIMQVALTGQVVTNLHQLACSLELDQVTASTCMQELNILAPSNKLLLNVEAVIIMYLSS